jgi:hypothetical protein
MVGKLKEISGLDIVAPHQLAQNHYFVIINVPQCLNNSHHDNENLSPRLLTRLRRTAGTTSSARNSVPSELSSDHLSFLQDKLRRECEFMRWVSSSKNIPMPVVHCYDASVATPYMVTDKCEGSLLIDAFGILPFEAKVVFKSPLSITILC